MAQMKTEIRVPSAHANTQTSLYICSPRTREPETEEPGSSLASYSTQISRFSDGGGHLVFTTDFHVTLHTHTKGEGEEEGDLT